LLSQILTQPRPERVDFEAERRKLAGRCFICEMLRGNLDYFHHVVYEDDRTVAFLQRY
jgi:histidine triad (HIT) family protein/ATP adenylyltransferase